MKRETRKMSRFLKVEFQGIEPYTPGEQPKDAKLIKLNTNESPYPPSPKVIEAINREEVEKLRLYSDPGQKSLWKQQLNITAWRKTRSWLVTDLMSFWPSLLWRMEQRFISQASAMVFTRYMGRYLEKR